MEPLTVEQVDAVRRLHDDAGWTPEDGYSLPGGLELSAYGVVEALLANLAACDEAYLNNSTERDHYEVAYRDMRTVVKRVMDDPALSPNLLTRLAAVYNDGEITE